MQNSHNNRQLGNSPGSSNRLNNLPSSHRNQPSRHSLNSSQSPSGNNNTIYNYFSPSYIPPPPPETLSSSPYTRKSTSAAFNSLTAIPSTSSPVPSPYVAHNRSSTQPRAPGVNQIDHSSSNTLSNSNNALVNPVRYPENSNSKIDCKNQTDKHSSLPYGSPVQQPPYIKPEISVTPLNYGQRQTQSTTSATNRSPYERRNEALELPSFNSPPAHLPGVAHQLQDISIESAIPHNNLPYPPPSPPMTHHNSSSALYEDDIYSISSEIDERNSELPQGSYQNSNTDYSYTQTLPDTVVIPTVPTIVIPSHVENSGPKSPPIPLTPAPKPPVLASVPAPQPPSSSTIHHDIPQDTWSGNNNLVNNSSQSQIHRSASSSSSLSSENMFTLSFGVQDKYTVLDSKPTEQESAVSDDDDDDELYQRDSFNNTESYSHINQHNSTLPNNSYASPNPSIFHTLQSDHPLFSDERVFKTASSLLEDPDIPQQTVNECNTPLSQPERNQVLPPTKTPNQNIHRFNENDNVFVASGRYNLERVATLESENVSENTSLPYQTNPISQENLQNTYSLASQDFKDPKLFEIASTSSVASDLPLPIAVPEPARASVTEHRHVPEPVRIPEPEHVHVPEPMQAPEFEHVHVPQPVQAQESQRIHVPEPVQTFEPELEPEQVHEQEPIQLPEPDQIIESESETNQISNFEPPQTHVSGHLPVFNAPLPNPASSSGQVAFNELVQTGSGESQSSSSSSSVPAVRVNNIEQPVPNQEFNLPVPTSPVHRRARSNVDPLENLDEIHEAPPEYTLVDELSEHAPPTYHDSSSPLQSPLNVGTNRSSISSGTSSLILPPNNNSNSNHRSSVVSTSSRRSQNVLESSNIVPEQGQSPSSTSAKLKFWKIKSRTKRNSDGSSTSVAVNRGSFSNPSNRNNSLARVATNDSMDSQRHVINSMTSLNSIISGGTLGNDNISPTSSFSLIPDISNTKSPDLKLKIFNPRQYYDIGDKIKGVLKFSKASNVAPDRVAVALILTEQATKRRNQTRSSKKPVSKVVVLASCRQNIELDPEEEEEENDADSHFFKFNFELEIPESYPQHHQLPIKIQRRLPPSFVTIEQDDISSDTNVELTGLYETEANQVDATQKPPKDKNKVRKGSVSTAVNVAKSFPGIKIAYNVLGLIGTKRELPADPDLVPFLLQAMKQHQTVPDDEIVVQTSVTLNVQPSYTPTNFDMLEMESSRRRGSLENQGGAGVNGLAQDNPLATKKLYKTSSTISGGGLLRSSVKMGIAEMHVMGLQYYSTHEAKPVPGQEQQVQGNGDNEVENNNEGSEEEEEDGADTNNRKVVVSVVPNTNEGSSIGLNFLFFPDPGARTTNIPIIVSVAMILRCRQVVSLSGTPFTSYPTSAYVSSASNIYERKQEVTVYEKTLWHSKWAKMHTPEHLSRNTKMYWTCIELPFTGISDLQKSTKYQSNSYNLQVVPSYISSFSCRDYEVEIVVKFDPPKTSKTIIPLTITSAMVPKSFFPWTKPEEEAA